MNFLAHAIAHDPKPAVVLALVAARIPTIVEQPVFAGLLVVQDVRVLARDGAVDGMLLGEGQIVASRHSLGLVDIDQTSDVGARLLQRDLGLVRNAGDHYEPGGSASVGRFGWLGLNLLGQRFDAQPVVVIARFIARDANLYAKVVR